MIAELTTSGSLPALEKLVQFTEARQRVLAHNVANISTPYYRPMDLDIQGFRRQLQKAVDDRRARRVTGDGEMALEPTGQVREREDGRLEVTPEPMDANVMFHDRNNRHLEKQMQAVAENLLTHQAAVQLLRNQFTMMRNAIRDTR